MEKKIVGVPRCSGSAWNGGESKGSYFCVLTEMPAFFIFSCEKYTMYIIKSLHFVQMKVTSKNDFE